MPFTFSTEGPFSSNQTLPHCIPSIALGLQSFLIALDNSVLKGRIGWQGLTTAEYR